MPPFTFVPLSHLPKAMMIRVGASYRLVITKLCDCQICLSAYEPFEEKELVDSDSQQFQTEYLNYVGILQSAFMASAGAALAFPGASENHPSWVVNAYYTAAFGLGIPSLLLNSYLSLAIRGAAGSDYLRPKSCQSVPLIFPGLILLSSGSLLLLGVLAMIYYTWNPGSSNRDTERWCHLLVILPISATLLISVGVVISTEMGSRTNRRLHSASCDGGRIALVRVDANQGLPPPSEDSAAV